MSSRLSARGPEDERSRGECGPAVLAQPVADAARCSTTARAAMAGSEPHAD